MGRNFLLSRSVLSRLRTQGSKMFATSTSEQHKTPDLKHTITKKGGAQLITSAVVTEMKMLTHNVKWLNLLVDDKNFNFKAGQWIDMHITGMDMVGGFSIACPPSVLKKTGFIELAVKYTEHPPAYWIHTQCKPSERVKIGVGGSFYFDPKVQIPVDDVLLLAGGMGINPLYSILGHIQDLNNFSSGPYRANITLLYCARTVGDLIWKENIEKICKNNANMNAAFYVSREDKTPPDVKSGRIKHKDVHAAVSKFRPGKVNVYICGPFSFIEDMVRHCFRANVTADKVFFEKWSKD